MEGHLQFNLINSGALKNTRTLRYSYHTYMYLYFVQGIKWCSSHYLFKIFSVTQKPIYFQHVLCKGKFVCFRVYKYLSVLSFCYILLSVPPGGTIMCESFFLHTLEFLFFFKYLEQKSALKMMEEMKDSKKVHKAKLQAVVDERKKIQKSKLKSKHANT